MTYLVYIKPFDTKIKNYLEIYNELTILISSYHMLLFTDFVMNEYISYNAGWSFLSFYFLNIVININVIIYFTTKTLIAFFKRLIARIKSLYN